jgi:uncharacterized membrane-anchored protein
MNTTAKKWFWVLVIAQAVFLLGWSGYHEYVRQTAQVLLLKGRPVDPQDILRGDFMTLRYDISTVKLPAGAVDGRAVWVLLEKKGSYHEAVSASWEKPAPGPGQVLVRGDMGYGWANGAPASDVRYGIEKYFVPEGKGSPRFKLMEVEVSVSSAHRLYIKRVLLDGKAFP